MFVPIILGSDKTTVSVATGQNEFYPLYMSIGNVHNKARRAHAGALALIGFLAIPKTDRTHSQSADFRNFRRQIFHSSLKHILTPLKAGMTTPEVVRCPDGHFRRAIYGIGPYIGDYPEQVLVACIVQGWCARCTAHRLNLDHDGTSDRRTRKLNQKLVKEFELPELWTEYGIVGNASPFTEFFPRADIYEVISPDILHQLIKGTFKDHLVTWVEKYLGGIYSEQQAAEIMADIDRRIAAVPPFTGLRRFPQGRGFKQWTGDDSKALMKVYLPALEGYVPVDMLRAFRAFLEFCYIVRHEVITEGTLQSLREALERYHHYRKIFVETGCTTSGFALPRQHSMVHYFDLIRLFGAPNGLCSSITESKHSKAVKGPWRRSNRYNPLGQVLYINQRLDKLAAMRVDFTERGMIEATGLRATLDLIESLRNEKNLSIHASVDEEDGAAIEDPSIPTKVELAKRLHLKINIFTLATQLGQPQLPALVRRFLYDQKFPNSQRDSSQVSLHACPEFNGSVSIVASASATFFAPSDPSGITGNRREHIRATESWRNGPARYDCVLVNTNSKKGPRGLSVARLFQLCSFEHEGVTYPTAFVQWFSYVGSSFDEDTGMWIVEPDRQADGSPSLGLIHAGCIYRACHLIPVYGTVPVPRQVTPHDSLSIYKAFYLNKFADHHAFETLS